MRTETIEIPASTRTITYYECELCGYESKESGKFVRCDSCRRIVCRTLNSTCSHNDPEDGGDYPDHYCNVCYQIKYVDLKEHYYEAEKCFEIEIDRLDREVKELSNEKYKERKKEI